MAWGRESVLDVMPTPAVTVEGKLLDLDAYHPNRDPYQIRRYGKIESTTHGRTNTSAYWRWRAMIQRCTNPKNSQWTSYGGRGIAVCERWRTFENFYADMGDPPPGMSLDRIDVNGNYEPSNCRWATFSRQARNLRKTPMLTFNGETLPLIDWAERLGINFRTLHSRLKKRGWTVERTLTTPAERGEQ
jgi:hypothetical protein